MTPKEQNILDTLNLLILLFRAQKQTFPAPSDEQQHILKVTKEHLTIAQISIPVFINTLSTLHEKGYLFGITIFEDKFHTEIQNAFSDKIYPKLLEQVTSLDTDSLSQKIKEFTADSLQRIAPPDFEVDREGIMKEDVTLKTMLDNARTLLANHTSNDIAVVFLMPFRSIERLLEKMNSGMKFDEVQDAGIWYNPIKYEFHFGDEVVSTAYRGYPTKAHHILDALFNNSKDPIMDYSDISEFNNTNDSAKENKAFSDAMRNFMSKHPQLSKIFVVYSDRLELQEEYKDDVH